MCILCNYYSSKACVQNYIKLINFLRKQAIMWMEGDSVRAREMSKLQHKSDKAGKAEKIAKAEKLEKQAWIEKIERQEKLRGMRVMDPLEAHMLSKISAGVDTMLLTGKRKEYLVEEVRGEKGAGQGREGVSVLFVKEGGRNKNELTRSYNAWSEIGVGASYTRYCTYTIL